ncbi:MAG: T9SS type A sorting domain-containing protein [candidate division WOR-3 bacterium]
MKKLIVIAFIFLLAGAEWQKRDEFSLPKGIQINDIKVGADGNIWILTKSSISRLEPGKRNLSLFSEIREAKLFAVDDDFFIVDANNKISVLSPSGEVNNIPVPLLNPLQAELLKIGGKEVLAIGEPNRIIFIERNEIIGSLTTNLKKFSIRPRIDGKGEIVIYTMNNNQIHRWTGKDLKAPTDFKNELLYSAPENILDFTTGFDEKSYILVKDSIIVLNDKGEREVSIVHESITPEARIYPYLTNNNLLLFNPNEKKLIIFSPIRSASPEIVILHKNRPNPVENYTEFEFTLNEPMYLTFTIYNLIGKPVKVLAHGFYNKGTYTIPWNADDEKGLPVPNGVYFYRLETKKGVLIKQLIVLK